MAEKTVKNSLGLGPAKVKLVADLTAEYKKLNDVLTKTKELSDKIATNLKGMAGGGGGGASAMTTPTPQPGSSAGVVAPGLPPLPNAPQRFDYGKAAAAMAGVAVNAMVSSVDASSYVSNEIMRKQFGFYSGIYSPTNGNRTNTAARMSAERMNTAGTPMDALDAARAAMAGASNGMGPGLRNYSTIQNSVAGVSNLMPGAGLEGGMNAVTALNQGSSVNRLRMIGVNVRDQNGYMRDIEDIARDFWNMLNKTKSGGKTNISEQDLAYSLQPGNSIDMALNQYFGNDAVLRQSITAYLFQFAKNNGKAFGSDSQGRGYTSRAGKGALEASGGLPQISQSIAGRNSAGFNVTDAYTGAGVGGVIGANGLIQALSNTSAALSPVLSPLVTGTTFAQTIGSAGNGAGGIISKGILDTVSGLAKGAIDLAKIGSMLNAEVIALGAAAVLTTGVALGVSDHNKEQTATDNQKADLGYTAPTGTSSTGTSTTTPKLTGKVMTDSAAVWANKLLAQMNIKATPQNTQALVNWMMHENTKDSHWVGDRNNPLNITSDYNFGAVNDTRLGKGAKVKMFDTEEGGIAATALQLTSNSKPGDQYYSILQDLKAGSDEGKTWADITASPWAAGNYGVGKTGGAGRTYYGNNITVNVTSSEKGDALGKAIAQQIDETLARAAAQH